MPAAARSWNLRVFLALALLLSLAWGCYHPGLSGGFLFDDFVNLNALGSRGPIDNWPAFWRYITSGTADPTGRPLSLLTFLLDARDWPADPAPFLRTNLLLHLLNGALLFLLVRRLETIAAHGERKDLVALLAAAWWLLHPLFVSTTLYVVQREAMLPATFTLLGLHLFVAGRQRYLASGGTRGMPAMAVGLLGGTALATLCKANGILLPVLALVLVVTVANPPAALDTPARKRLRNFDALLLWLPCALLALYLLRYLPRLHVDLAHRPWTIAERLLTEPRVLMDYLGLLAIPRAVSTGLFNDQYAVSTSLWQPATTLPALLAILALVMGAVVWRRRQPRLAAALLFFFAGHLLESSVIPLELYFEHRNYLPALLLGWPLADVLTRAGRWRRARMAGAAGLLALLAFTTWQRATLWGQPEQLARVWALRNPESPRVQAVAGMALMREGRNADAARELHAAWQRQPGEPQIALNYVNARCASGGLTPADTAGVGIALRQAQASHLMVHQWLSRMLEAAAQGTCPGLDLGVADAWLAAVAANPAFNAGGVRRQDLLPLLGELETWRGQPRRALAHFKEAIDSHPNPDFAARLVAFLASHGEYRAALDLLDHYERLDRPWRGGAGMVRVHAWVLDRQGFWPREFAVLRRKLEAEQRTAGDGAADHGSP